MYQFKVSSLAERREFYVNEFSSTKVKEWLAKIGFYPQFFVLDAGTETGIIKDAGRKGKLIVLRPNISVRTLKEKLVFYLPEDVYIDRNKYLDLPAVYQSMNFKRIFRSRNCREQLLAFDFDSWNIKCSKCRGRNFLFFCENCFAKTAVKALEAYRLLRKSFGRVEVVYSGRGFHIYVLGRRAMRLTVLERERLNKRLARFPIDSWVSRGYIRLMRLPYSLNSIVSRIAIPLSSQEIVGFNPTNDKRVVPGFLRG